MNTLSIDRPAARVNDVRVTNDTLVLDLMDGRVVSAPLVWYPRLLHGSTGERAGWELIGEGEGIHWPQLDEDLSVESVLAGRPSSESAPSLQKWLAVRAANAPAAA